MRGPASTELPIGSTNGIIPRMNECCFCGTGIDPAEPGSLTFVVAAAARFSEPDAPTQQLWCHAMCLGERLVPRVPFDARAFDD
jgi:hypothetical protein